MNYRFLILFFLCNLVNVKLAEANDPKQLIGKQSLAFIENKGQWDNQVAYFVRNNCTDAWFFKNGNFQINYYTIESKNDISLYKNNDLEKYKNVYLNGQRILFRWINANADLNFEQINKQTTYYNYLIGKDQSKHVSNVGLFNQIIGKNLYNGIDLKLYSQNNSIRYDFVIQPNSDANQIKLQIDGANKLNIDANGNVVINTAIGDIKMQDLYVYELETHKPVSCKWILNHDILSLDIGTYNKNNTLIIDPLIYSTYVGGSSNQLVNDIAVDTSGNAYITGMTQSADFNSTLGAYQQSFAGSADVFISKLNTNGSAFVFSTFLGGGGGDIGYSITIDSLSNSYITGSTNSTDFDVTSGAYQTVKGLSNDVFVTKLSSLGTALIYSSFIGGAYDDQGYGIAIDKLGNAFITGKTQSADYPTTVGAFQTSFKNQYEAYVSKIDATGSSLIYSTYLNGALDDIGNDITIDKYGSAYITGSTLSHFDFVTSGVHSSGAGTMDVFVTKLSSNGSTRIYSTCIGGSGPTFASGSVGYGIKVDDNGNVFVAGSTVANNFDITSGSYQTNKGDTLLNEAFVFKLNSSATALIYSTFVGGNSNDVAYDLSIDKYGSAYIAGLTQSTNFPVTPGAIQSVNDGSGDVFFSKLNPSGNYLEYSTYLGGSKYERAFGIVFEEKGNVFIAGEVNSTNFDVTPSAMNLNYGGGSLYDGFVSKIGVCQTIDFTVTSNNISCNGFNDGSGVINITNPADYVFSWLPSGGNSLVESNLTAGTYTITVSDSNGCSSHQLITLTEPPPINANIIGKDSICLGENTTLVASGGGSYNWSNSAITDSIVISPLNTTTYSVVVTLGACADTVYETVEVLPLPVITFTGKDSICVGQNTILTATGGGSYNWNTGSLTDSINVTPLNNTIYNVIVNNNGCVDTGYVTVYVNPLPVAVISGNTVVCSGQSTTLVASGSTFYNWNTGSTNDSIIVNPTVNANYSVIVKDGIGCADTATVAVSVLPLPNIYVAGDSVICEGESANLLASGSGNFLWNTSDTTSLITVSPPTTTLYYATATNSCGTAVDSISVLVNLLPTANVSNDTVLLLGTSTTIYASGGSSYVWFPSTGLSCTTCSNPIASPQNTTTYTVTISNSNGCTITKTITITIENDFEIFVPDIFSPNSDGYNDVLYVRGKGIKSMDFKIYDRLGEKIFESTDVSIGWDGTYKGNLLNNAVFVYYLTVNTFENKEIKLKGDVTLVR